MYRSYEEYMRNVLNYKSNGRINIMEDFDRNIFAGKNPYMNPYAGVPDTESTNKKIPKLNITNFNNLQ